MRTWQYEEMEDMYTWLFGKRMKPWIAGALAAALIAAVAYLFGSQGT